MSSFPYLPPPPSAHDAAPRHESAGADGPLGSRQPQAYLNIRKFNIREQLPFDPVKRQGPIIICVGRRGTGKSELIKDICYQFHKDVKRVIVMSGTEDCSPFYRDFVPAICIRNKYQASVGAKIVADQYQTCMDFYRRMDAGDPAVRSEDHRIMWIIDDCMYDDSWAKTELMRYIFTCGRHIKILLLIAMQYPLGIPPMLRGNVDAIFLTRDMGSNVRKLFEIYGSGIFDNFEEFKLIYNQLTVGYSAMVLYMSQVKDTTITGTVFTYRATIRDHFRMGLPREWEESREYARDAQRRRIGGADEYQAGMNRASRRSQVQVDVFTSGPGAA